MITDIKQVKTMDDYREFITGEAKKELEAAIIKLQDHDILVVRLLRDVDSPHEYGMIRDQVQCLVGMTGRKNLGVCVVPREIEIDLLKSEKELRALRMEITELKQTVAKLLPK